LTKFLRAWSATESAGPVLTGADHAQMGTISSPSSTCSTGMPIKQIPEVKET